MLPKLIVGTVDVTTRREIAQHLEKNAISVVRKNTLAKCVNPQVKDLKSLSQSVTQGGLDKPMINVLNVNAEYMRLVSVKMTWRT